MVEYATYPSQKTCRLCGAGYGDLRIEFGKLPPCNRFVDSAETLPSHQLTMGACGNCGLIQLLDPMPPDMVRPRVPWIRYNEPSAHLGGVADRILEAIGRRPITALGIGPFEQPLLEELRLRDVVADAPRLNFQPTDGSFPYLETWQAELSRGSFSGSEGECGKADVVSCRFLLEHCHAPLDALHALGKLATSDGLVVIEVPDSSKFLASGDYAFPWEEHVCYFTAETLVGLCRRAGFVVIEMLRYNGDLEDVLVALARPADEPGSSCSKADLSFFLSYRDRYAGRQEQVRRALSRYGGDGGHVALFGAGHQSIMFANALKAAPLLSYVVDDDPKKVGMIAPGFSSEIRRSADLIDDAQIRACLLGVSPRAEPKVRSQLQKLTDRGVRLHSIFAGAVGSIFSGEPQ
ncbi:D-mycarose 3-C-methyltransferase [Methylocystis bryophila]|nr:D-mycarose 3-C-methyltransferase [Methylocystis bryophila]